MRIYTHTQFDGHYPVGTSAVIVAKDRGHAKRLLTKELEELELKQDEELKLEDFTEVDITKVGVDILQDGNY